MSYEILSSDGDKRTIRFLCDAATVDTAFSHARARINRDLHLPGFRPGRVPRSIIDSRFGNLIHAEVAEELRERQADILLEEQDWILADRRPEGDGNLPSEGQDYAFELTFRLFETPVPKGYSGLEIRLPKFDVDQAVERTLQSIRAKMVHFEPVDRAAAAGDLVLVEAHQETAEGSPPERMALRLGDDSLGPGLDSILEGRSSGDSFSARIELAEEGGDGSKQGKETRFTVFQVREPRLPDLDDEFAKSAGGCENLEEFRTRLAQRLEARWQEDRGKEIETQALDIIVQANPFEPPAYMVENLKADLLSDVQSKDGDGTDEYASLLAAHKVKEFLLLRGVALAEKLEPAESEVETEMAADRSRSSAVDRLRNRKALEFVLSHAEVLEVDPQPVESGEESSGPSWRWKVLEPAPAGEGNQACP